MVINNGIFWKRLLFQQPVSWKKGWTKKNHKYISREMRNGKYYYVYNPSTEDSKLQRVLGEVNFISTTEKDMQKAVEKVNQLIDESSKTTSPAVKDGIHKELEEEEKYMYWLERVANEQRQGRSGIGTK